MREGAARELALESDGGPLHVTREDAFSFTVDMGAPRLGWSEIPLAGRGGDTARVALIPPVAGAPDHFSAVSMGNPHAIFFVADFDPRQLARLGSAIETHPLFPEHVNASFAEVRGDDEILLFVWERGAGATRACGTAACAAAVAAVRTGLTGRTVGVTLPGGLLRIHWRESDDHVLMTGPVEFEFETILDAGMFAQCAT
jgi:diaminopimelate epimerase